MGWDGMGWDGMDGMDEKQTKKERNEETRKRNHVLYASLNYFLSTLGPRL